MSMNFAQAQCDLSFEYVNTGTNMTAFFTPSMTSAIHTELGDGTLILSILMLMVRLFVVHLLLLMVLKFSWQLADDVAVSPERWFLIW